MAEKGHQGYANTDEERRHESSTEGGHASHERGTAHEFNDETDAGRREVARRVAASALQPASAAPGARSQRTWPARHPILVGTLAGAGIGLGMLAAEGCDSSDFGCPGLALFFGGTGAGLGALGGAVASIFLR